MYTRARERRKRKRENEREIKRESEKVACKKIRGRRGGGEEGRDVTRAGAGDPFYAPVNGFNVYHHILNSWIELCCMRIST